MTKVNVHECRAAQEGGVMTLAFTGSMNGGDAYLVLSLDEKPDRQDIELGLVGVHVEWNDQAHSGYSMIRSARWDDADLAITITEVGQKLGIPAIILLHKATSHLGSDDRTITETILAYV